ncbi:ubiquitin-activating enzyme [Candidatus Poribacteria bacterium]|nr:ubiquitin-activating enzyme [Gammaproteobacteria bacterium]MYF99190.1 ubiquitin-activating enzyme [Candidatus Poribacteria bacterium]
MALQLEARLRERTEQAPERLDARMMRRCYPRRQFVAGWRIGVTFSDEIVRHIDLVATAGFPSVPVRTALVDHPPFMTWPHVESDGIMCLLPNMAECDPDDPCAVAENLLGRSVQLVEDLLEGSIIERDFREEFLTYWQYKSHEDGTRFFSLLTPEPPSRVVRVWRDDGLEIAGEDESTLMRWVRRRFGTDAHAKTEEAAFIWLSKPPLPVEYPETASDLHVLAVNAGQDAASALAQAAVGEPDQVVALLGARGRGGSGLIAVKASNPRTTHSRPHSVTDPLSKGFRPGRTPKPLLLRRFFGFSPVIRSSIQRADAHWVHGRGRDPRTARLLDSTVVVFGCGSVGSPVACTLAQAGVGNIILVDVDTLSWPNVGRHPLGATAVGLNKAESLAKRLQADFPHLRIDSRTCSLQEFLRNEPELLGKADLIIAATGSWGAESALNRWHVEQGRQSPILYGWTEAHACAGHAVAIVRKGGCFQCHISQTGSPSFRVAKWPDGGDPSQEEPACGAHYDPYGPVELSYVTAMISDMALDCLLSPPSRSISRVFATSTRRIAELGGLLSDEWLIEHGENDSGIRTVDRDWPENNCVACGDPPVEEAA